MLHLHRKLFIGHPSLYNPPAALKLKAIGHDLNALQLCSPTKGETIRRNIPQSKSCVEPIKDRRTQSALLSLHTRILCHTPRHQRSFPVLDRSRVTSNIHEGVAGRQKLKASSLQRRETVPWLRHVEGAEGVCIIHLHEWS